MKASSIPCIAMASVIIFLGAFSAFVYARRRTKAPELLSFAVTCFFFSIYAIVSAFTYSADSYAEGRSFQPYAVASVFLSSVALLRFIGDFTGGRVSRVWFWSLSAPIAGGTILDLFWKGDLVFRESMPSIKVFDGPFGFDVVYFEMQIGPVVAAQFAFCFAMICYAIHVAYRFMRAEGVRRRAVLLLIATMLLALSALNDFLVNAGFYSFYYTIEYAFMAIVFLMAYSFGEESVKASEIIRERNELEERLREAEKMEAIGRLAGGIAHDLNNMLTPIIGYVDIAQRRKKTHEQLMEYLSRIGDAAEHSRRLTWQLLAFSRKQLLHMRVLDLNEVVTRAEQMLRSLIPEDIEIRLLLSPDAGHVLADETQLQQILVNLAINARDAMRGGGRLLIETRAERADEALGPTKGGKGRTSVLSVKDSGHGMDAETAARVFEPFFTTKERGRGTGLGLATVYGIVRQHDGTIEIDSAQGVGTEFRVYLRTVDAPLSPSISAPQPPSAKPGDKRILVVEDEESVRTWVLEVLRGQGYQVIEAKSPDEALKLVARGDLPRIDLLLTDVVMPGMNGFRLHERLEAFVGYLRVLYISGYSSDAVAERGMPGDSVVLLHKPFTVEKLLSALGEVLSRTSSPG